MAYTPPTGTIGATWLGAPSYVAPSPNIAASWRVGVSYIGVASFNVARYGTAFVTKQQFVNVPGLAAGAIGVPLPVRKGEYIPPTTTFTATWLGQPGYLPNSGTVSAQWNNPFTTEQSILGAGFDASDYGVPSLYQPQIAYTVGIEPPANAVPVPRLYRDNEYVPPYAIINGSWFNATSYEAPHAIVNGQWKTIDAPPNLIQTFGAEFIEFGLAGVHTAEQVKPTSFVSSTYGAPLVRLGQLFVRPSGFGPATWNATNSGTVLNWQQPARPSGLSTFASGSATVTNKTATRVITPGGIASAAYGTLSVSPRIIYATQFNASAYGTPTVQSPPRPVGFDSSAFGFPVVLDNRQHVYPVGFNAIAFGLASTRRLQEYVYPPSVLESTLFGDLRPILRQRYVLATSVNDSFVSPFASVDNRNRTVVPFPTPTTAFGTSETFNKSPNLTPTGIASLVFGAADIGHRSRPILFAGAIAPAGLGRPIVRNAAATIAPEGFVALLTTPPMVSYRVRTVVARGFAASAYGIDSIVWFRVRGISDVGGSDVARYGVATIDLKDRRVLDATVGLATVIPSPRTWFRVRTLVPAGIGFAVGRQFGTTTVQDATKRLGSAGAIAPGLFGVASARRNEVVVYPEGIAGEFGTTFVELATRYLGAHSFLSEEVFGQTVIFNSRQYVAPFRDPETVRAEGAVGTPWEVQNRNTTMRTFGFDMAIISNGATVELGGRDIHPVGTEFIEFGVPVLGDRVRTVRAEGWNSFFSNYSAVYNRSAVLEPSGIRAGQAGIPSIKDTRQFMDAVGGNDFTTFGDAFTAYAIRYVEIMRGIEEPRMLEQTVKQMKRFVEPPSIEGGLGVPTLEIRFNLVGPKGYPMDRYGEPFVRNVTPEVGVYGTLLTEYGRARVFNFISHVRPEGFGTLWGKGTVDFRLKTVRPGGFEALRIPALHEVSFDAPQIPPQQTVLLDGEGINESDVENPVLNLRGMRVEGFDAIRFGLPTCISYGIGPVTIPFDYNTQFGTPMLNGTQFVDVPSLESKVSNGLPTAGDGASFVGKPRITPFTVSLFLSLDAENEVDYDNSQPNHPWWGRAVVTSRDRTVRPSGYNPNTGSNRQFGDAEVLLMKQYVRPNGLMSFRYGVPSIPSDWRVYPYWGRDTEEEVPGVSLETAEYGVATVAFPIIVGPRTVRPLGMAGAFGVQRIELQHRTITNAGAIYGTVFTGLNWVHPPIKIVPKGFDSLAMGELATGLKYRYLQVDSSDMETGWGAEFDGGTFSPMRVRLARKLVEVAGISAGEVGLHYTGLRQQGVSVPGGPIGLLGLPAVLSSAKIAPAGFESLQMGNPKRAVYGTIEPYGDDMALYGIPGLDLGLHVPYIEPGLVGAPRVVRGILVPGLEGEFGSTVVVGESNCGSTLAVVAMMGDTSKFGQHGVRQ